MTPQPLRARTPGASSQRSLTRALEGRRWLATAAQAVSGTPSSTALRRVPAWLSLHQQTPFRFSECSSRARGGPAARSAHGHLLVVLPGQLLEDELVPNAKHAARAHVLLPLAPLHTAAATLVAPELM